jgi:hypothetical protein
MQRTWQSKLRCPRLARFPWFRALLLEVGRSDLLALLVKPQHRRRSKPSRREILQLLLIILASVVSVVIGIYGGVISSHDHEH